MSDVSASPGRFSFREVNRSLTAGLPPDSGVRLFTGLSLLLTLLFLVAISVLFFSGVGIWGIAIPVGWGFAIVSFVWWSGLAHGATLTSAGLLLMRRSWRSPLARAAETIALLALLCGSLFPLLHLGRPNVFYWMMPYPNTMGLWPQFRSALQWDVFAVLCYGGAALLFWYIPLIPDLATLRDRAGDTRKARMYGVLALGWRGAGTHWMRQEYAYRLIGGIALVLIFAFHTITGFAVTVVPGWHSTLLPPFFLAGAALSGAGALLVFATMIRRFPFHAILITPRHLDGLAKIFLVASLAVAYGHAVELTLGSGGSTFEKLVWQSRVSGANAQVFWLVVLTTVVGPQLFWSPRMRRNRLALIVVPILAIAGVWADRFILVVTPLQRDHLPSSWEVFNPTVWDALTLLGSVGVFLLGLILATRLLPVAPISEMQEQLRSNGHVEPGRTPSTVGRHEGDRNYGLLAEFASPAELIQSAREAWVRGHRDLETFTPFPLPELRGLLTPRSWIIGMAALAGAVGTAAAGYALQYYASAISYPLNVGGRPLHSWPAFVPITVQAGLLGAAMGAFVVLLFLNRLPALHHPLFAVPGFERSTIDRFFLFIPSRSGRHNPERLRRWLQRKTTLPVRTVRW